MFTGLIATTGTVHTLTRTATDWHMAVASSLNLDRVALGASIAVNGVCLTVTAKSSNRFQVDLSAETVARTTLARMSVGATVNLEQAMVLGDRLDGHWVQGHVDGIGTVEQVISQGRSINIWIQVAAVVGRYLIAKGSIAVDGVSLTINDLDDHAEMTRFSVRIIPHTQQRTTLSTLTAGQLVNVETDLLGRYVERLLSHRAPCRVSPTTIDRNYLLEQGIIR
ncbi:MAG: riboflavin synthase [Magnetococcales bacterium]|nr:riboflavin synthase [Magnetococcales bacterium]